MDGIERGLRDLKEIGADMGKALDEQYVLTAAIDDKVKKRRRVGARGLGSLLEPPPTPPTLPFPAL